MNTKSHGALDLNSAAQQAALSTWFIISFMPIITIERINLRDLFYPYSGFIYLHHLCFLFASYFPFVMIFCLWFHSSLTLTSLYLSLLLCPFYVFECETLGAFLLSSPLTCTSSVGGGVSKQFHLLSVLILCFTKSVCVIMVSE